MIQINTDIKKVEQLVTGHYYLARFKGHGLSTRKPDPISKVYLCQIPASGKILLKSVDLILHKLVPNDEYEEAQFFHIDGRVDSHAAMRLLSGPRGYGTENGLEKLLEDVQEVLEPLVEKGGSKLKSLYERVKILNS